MTFSEEQSLRIDHDSVVSRPAEDGGGGVVLFELSTTTYLTLNGSARVLWERLADGASPVDLAEVLVSHYGISDRQARADTASFLATLDERGLVVASD